MKRALIKILSFLIIIFPFMMLLFGWFLGNNINENWYESISATYYGETKGLFIFYMFLLATLFSLIDIKNIIISLAFITIAIFPCGDANLFLPRNVGVFKLPVEISDLIHNIANFILILSISIKSVYRVIKEKILFQCLPCLIAVIIAFGLIIAESIYHNTTNIWDFHWIVIFCEIILFDSTGILFLIGVNNKKLLI